MAKSQSLKKNDVFLYDKKIFYQKKADLKTVHSGSKETIRKHIISGSEQAGVVVLDIQGGTKSKNLIKGLREGWKNQTKEVLLYWKKDWYLVKKQNIFNQKWISDNLK